MILPWLAPCELFPRVESPFVQRMLWRRYSGFVDRNAFAIVGGVLAWFAFAGAAHAQAPAITAISAPRQVVTMNQNLALSVTATGASSYQWKRNGRLLPGATAASYAITGAIPHRDNGWYQAIATNSSGATTSAVVFVNVAVEPAQLVGSGTSHSGELIVPSGLTRVTAVAAGARFSLALKSDGTVVAWGNNYYGVTQVPSGLTEVVAVTAGPDRCLALKSNGTVVAWGVVSTELRNGLAGLTGVVAVATGGSHDLALKSDGTVVAWGGAGYGEGTVPSGLSGVVAVAAGHRHSLVLKGDGTLFAWGDNTSGQSTIPSGLSGVVAVSAAVYHSLALKSDGTVAVWGSSIYGLTTVPSGLSGVVAIAAGASFNLTLRSDGTMVGWGSDWYAPAVLHPGSGPVSMIAARNGHSIFLTTRLPLSATVTVPSTLVTIFAQTSFRPVHGRGGSVTYLYSVSPNLPSGLQLDPATGYIWHWATSASPATTYTVTVRDAANPTAGSVSATFSLTVTGDFQATIAIPEKALPFGATVAPFVPVMGTGGIPPYTYAISPALMTGLSFNPTTGAISGSSSVTTTAGIPYDITVTDSARSSATKRIYLTVKSALVPAVAVATKVLPINAAAAAFTPVVAAGGTAPYSFAVSPALPAGLSLSASTGAITGTPTVLSPASSYAMTTTDADGLTASRSFMLTVTPPFPAITPVSALRQTVARDANLTLSVTPGDATSFQWLRNGRPLPGATTTSFTITAADPLRDNGWYQAVGTNSYGSTTSAAIFVNVAISPAQVVGNGANSSGQIAIPSGLTSVAAVVAGYFHSLALRSDGTVTGWGSNSLGQITIPSDLSDVVAVSGGYLQSFALKSDGTLVGWGSNANRELSIPSGLSGVVAISAGRSHCLALKGDGTLAVWGYNGGNGAGSIPNVPNLAGDMVAVAAGASHNVVLKRDGTVYGWGYIPRAQATPPDGLGNVVAVAAGAEHSLALKSDGTVVGWGDDTYRQATIPSGLSDVVAIAAGETHSVALKSDGTVVAWGGNVYGQTTLPGALGTVAMVSTGATSRHNLFLAFSLPLTADVAAPSKILTVGAAANFNPVTAVAGAAPYSYRVSPALPAGLALNTSTGAISGTPLAAASPAAFTVTITDAAGATVSQSFTLSVNNAPLIAAISGPQQVVTLNQDLTLNVTAIGATRYQWNRNGRPVSGATDASYAITGAVPVRDNGWYQVIATNASGSTTSAVIFVNVAVSPAQVVGNGYNLSGQITIPSGLSNVLSVAGGAAHSLALKGDGTVAGWGYNDERQVTIPSALSGVVAVAAGAYHSLALKSDGTVVAWGAIFSNYGQVTIPRGLSNVVAVAAGAAHSLALKSDGTVIGWGSNFTGQSTIPSGLIDVVAVAAGQEHNLVLKSDGTVVAWGRNDSGQTTVPGGLSGVVAVAAGNHHNLALKSDGTVVAWGRNDYGQTTIPSGLRDVVAVSGGQFHSLALKSDGTLVAWGQNELGQAPFPNGLSGVLMVSAGYNHGLFLQVATTVAPEIASVHSTRVASEGYVTLVAAATGTGPLAYQWKKDGAAISGATGAVYTLSAGHVSASGVYSVTVTNAFGQVTAPIATVTVVPVGAAVSRLTNVSVRSTAGTGDQTLIVGLAIGGAGSKQVLLRGIGPGLTQFGLTGALADPQIRLFNAAGVQTNVNDDWSGGTAMINAFAAVGAFALSAASKDAALFVPLSAGTYSAQITSNAGAGTALVEAYDSDAATAAARIVNLSVRTQVGAGDDILIVGFVVAGNEPKTVLIRAVGPGLSQFGLSGVLTDPQLSLFKSGVSAAIEVNDNWGGGSALSAAFTASGAFGLAAASRDAVLLVALQPGAYTAQVSGVGGATGIALVELYEVP